MQRVKEEVHSIRAAIFWKMEVLALIENLSAI